MGFALRLPDARKAAVPDADPLASLYAQRHGQASACFAEGMDALQIARQSEFADRASARRALDCFVKTIQFQRQHVEAHVMGAYLALVFGQNAQAQQFLQAALRLEPEHELARTYLDFLIHPARVVASRPAEHAQIDEAALEARMHGLLKLSMQARLPDELPFEVAALAHLRTQAAGLDAGYRELLQSLQALDGEMDTMPLRMRLRPIEMLVHRQRGFVAASEQAQGLYAQMRQLGSLIERALADSAQDALPEADLDAWLDRLDAIADRLDDLSQSYTLSALIGHYEQLTARMTELQDRLD